MEFGNGEYAAWHDRLLWVGGAVAIVPSKRPRTYGYEHRSGPERIPIRRRLRKGMPPARQAFRLPTARSPGARARSAGARKFGCEPANAMRCGRCAQTSRSRKARVASSWQSIHAAAGSVRLAVLALQVEAAHQCCSPRGGCLGRPYAAAGAVRPATRTGRSALQMTGRDTLLHRRQRQRRARPAADLPPTLGALADPAVIGRIGRAVTTLG
jgi:hypothetical protein